jgi:putative FmdB family regulatory protein
MPLFVFECQECKKQHEVLVRGHEKPVCPDCGSKRLTKQASAFAPRMGPLRAIDNKPACSSCPGQVGGSCPYQS